MGVKVDRMDERFDAALETVASLPVTAAGTLDHRDNGGFLTIAQLLEKGEGVGWARDGAIVTGSTLQQAAWQLQKPRVALYQPWSANADQGWTEWVFDRYRVPYTLVHNSDFQAAALRERFDTLV